MTTLFLPCFLNSFSLSIALGKIKSFTPHLKNNSVAWLYSRKWANDTHGVQGVLLFACCYLHNWLLIMHCLQESFIYVNRPLYQFIYMHTHVMNFGWGSDGLCWFTPPPFIEKQIKPKYTLLYIKATASPFLNSISWKCCSSGLDLRC